MSYLADFGPLKEFIPDGLLDSLALGRAEECIQPLIDLGYLNPSDYHPRVATVAMAGNGAFGRAPRLFAQKMAAALAAFREDALAAELLSQGTLGIDLKVGEDTSCIPGTVELDLLHRLVALDGETILEEVPAIGQRNLDTRILHYQMQILGLYEGDPGAVLTEVGMKGIWQIQNWLGMGIEGEVLPLLGDIGALSMHLVDGLGTERHSQVVAYFKQPYRTMTGLGTKPRAFVKELKAVLNVAKAEEFFARVNPRRGRMVRRLVEPAEVAQLTRDPFNRFLLRLVQVRQWMRGFYQGKLDFWFGPRSLRSLKAYAEALDFEVGELLVRAGKDESGGEYWALNMAALLERIRDQEAEVAEDPTVEGLVDRFENLVDQLPPVKRVQVMGQLRIGAAAHHKAHQKGLPLGRRIYLGVKSMVLSIRSGFRKLAKWIGDGVAKLVNLGKNLFRLLSRQLREGLRSFGSGIAFLFSGKQVATQTSSGKTIVSDFDVDFDMTVVASEGVGAQDLLAHMELMESKVESLGFCLRLTGAVLNWVLYLVQGPVGWLKLALRVARQLRKMLLARLRRRTAVRGLQVRAVA